MKTPAVWWAKRDLRLDDNPALRAALADHPEVLPVFCVEPAVLGADDASPMHAHAQAQALAELRHRLRRRGGDVFAARGDAPEALARLRRWYPFAAVYSHEETGNAVTFRRDRAVAAWCRANGIRYVEVPQTAVRRGGIDRDRFDELWRERVAAARPLPAPGRVPLSAEVRLRCAATDSGPPRGGDDWQPVSETHAERTLRDFLGGRGYGYCGGISSPVSARVCGSRLSPHLAWGTISSWRVYHATLARLRDLRRDSGSDESREQWSRSLRAFLSRLRWRDHFVQRLESEPAMEFRPLHSAYSAVPWENDANLLAAWVEGRTGFPLVDATMRCLAATGFVNFRMRAMAVSFACHALHLDWRVIHPPLARVFRDYEPGIHLSQLQMQAGVTGMNTIRVYCPQKQLIERDARCRFVREWVPELRRASVAEIQGHAQFPVAGYAPPAVDFAARTRAMKDALFGLRAAQDPAEAARVWRRHGTRMAAPPARVRRAAPPAGRRDQPTLF